MKKRNYVYGEYFYGEHISSYGLQYGYVDYATFAKSFNAVLNNRIMEATSDIGTWECVQGGEYYEDEDGNTYNYYGAQTRIKELYEQIDALEEEQEKEDDEGRCEEIQEQIDAIYANVDMLEEEQYPEVYQWFIVSDGGARIIQDYTDETLYYNEELDVYLWGVAHYGTSWDYVLTSIKCNVGYNYNEEEQEEE